MSAALTWRMRNVFSSLLFVVAIGAVGTACTATGTARYSASATMPSMVYISPGVQVIEDYEEPVFYSSNVYWRYNGGIWYQSRTYTGGWVRVSAPPQAIVSIQRPQMYVRYRASARGGAQAGPAPVQQQRREERREDMQERREDQQERREDKREAQEERREDKQEKREDKQERKEDKQERREDKQERREDKHDNKKGHKK